MKSGLFSFDPSPGVVPPGSISNAELAPMAALTVKANPTNATGQPQDVAAAANDTFFQRVANALGFGQLTNGMVPANTVGLDKLANAAAQYDIIGRKTASAGAWEDCTRTDLSLPGLELSNIFTQSQTIQPASGVANISVNGDGSAANINGRRYQATAQGAVIQLLHARGSRTSPAAIIANDRLGDLNFLGQADSTTTVIGSAVRGTVIAATPSTTDMQSNVALFACPAASVTISAVLTVDHTSGLQAFGSNIFLDANRLLRRRIYTFGTLPAAGTAGRLAAISDGAAAPVWGANAAGGGTLNTPVYDNGAAWVNG